MSEKKSVCFAAFRARAAPDSAMQKLTTPAQFTSGLRAAALIFLRGCPPSEGMGEKSEI